LPSNIDAKSIDLKEKEIGRPNRRKDQPALNAHQPRLIIGGWIQRFLLLQPISLRISWTVVGIILTQQPRCKQGLASLYPVLVLTGH